ncbi:MAG: DUF2341 domain-containing protein, partial [Candidatus Omnitrophica bacterium]|nr:DUF2341 domain-containing protein [Candidatus Omnitrophota bacterium]
YNDHTFYKYDFATDSWNEPLVNRYQTGSNGDGNIVMDSDKNIYVAYATYTSSAPKHILVFSATESRWVNIIRTPFSLIGTCTLIFVPSSTPGDKGALIVTGGFASKKLYKYDLNTKVWSVYSTAPEMFSRGLQARYCPERDSIFFFGAGDWRKSLRKIYEVSIANPSSWNEAGALNFDPSLGNTNSLEYGLDSSGSPTLYLVAPDRTDTNFYSFGMPNPTVGIKNQSLINCDGETIMVGAGASLFYSTSPGGGRYLYLMSKEGVQFLYRYDINSGIWENTKQMPLIPNNSASSMIAAQIDDGAGGYKTVFYVYNPVLDRLLIYSPEDNIFNEPMLLPEYVNNRSATCGYKSYVYYLTNKSSGTTNLYRYSTDSDMWDKLAQAPSGLNITDWSPRMIVAEVQGKAYLYATPGRGYTTFWRYSISDNSWQQMATLPSGYSWNYSNSLVSKDGYIYAILGHGSRTILKYSLINNVWEELPSYPSENFGWGANLIYPGSGNIIYALRGASAYYNGNPTFMKFDTSKENTAAQQAWSSAPSCPMDIFYSDSSFIYPGFGNYFYLMQGCSNYQSLPSTVFLRYDFIAEQWSEFIPSPTSLVSPGTLAYPGGKYMYLFKGNNTDFMRYYAFSFGDYTSDVKQIGTHADWGQAKWYTNGLQSIKMSVRTSDNISMRDAVDWSKAVDLSPTLSGYAGGTVYSASMGGVASARAKDKYIQYKLSFSTNNLNETPILDKVSLEYTKYPTIPQEIVFNPVDTSWDKARVTKVNWTENLPGGTDVRFQLRSSGTNSFGDLSLPEFKGPSLIKQSFNYDFSSVKEYAMDRNIELSPSGGAVLVKPKAFTETISINNPGAGITDYQLKVTVDGSRTDFWNNVEVSGNDIRFFDSSNKRLDYWIESFVFNGRGHSSNNAVIWVKIPVIPAGASTIKVYYGNKTVAAESNFDRTMEVHKSDSNTIAFWGLEDGTGTNVTDITARNDMFANNGPTWAQGKLGNALYFSGANQYLETKASAIRYPYSFSTFNFNNSFTLEAWVKTTNAFGTIAMKMSNNVGFKFSVDNGKLKFAMSDGTVTAQKSSNAAVNNGAFHHVAVVIRREGSTNTGQFFIDGSPDSVGVFDLKSATGTPVGNITTAGKFWISSDNSVGNTSFTGTIDEVRLSNGNLSQAELLAHINCYKYSATPPVPSLGIASEISLFSGWKYRQPVEITYSASEDLTDWVGIITIDSSTSGNPDFWSHVSDGTALPSGADIRFSDGYQEIKYKLLRFDSSSNPKVVKLYLKIPYLLSTKTTRKIYMYYGNLLAEDGSAPVSEFINGDGLMGYWNFEEGSGRSVNDLSGNNNNGTIQLISGGAPSTQSYGWVAGKVGGALNLNGMDAYVEIPNAASINPSGSFSVEFWFNLKSNKHGGFVNKSYWYKDAEGRLQGFFVRSAWNYLYFYTGNKTHTTSDPSYVATSIPPLNTWHHLAAVYDSASGYKRMYLDGRLIGTDYNARFTPYSGALRIGLSYNNANYYHGRIDEVRFYNKALSETEVKSSYNSASSGEVVKLITYLNDQNYSDSVDPETTYGYSTDNPVVQPVTGIYYNYDFGQSKGAYIESFNPEVYIPSTSTPGEAFEVKYQISRDGWNWYYWNGSDWVLATSAGFAQANTKNEITNARLYAFQQKPGFNSGDFYFRAFLKSALGTNSPRLISASVVFGGNVTYYTDASGTTPVNMSYSKPPAYYTIINDANTNAIEDRYFQYKAILYSDGAENPRISSASVQYVKPAITVNSIKQAGTQTAVSILNMGNAYDITWTSDGINGATDTVKIELYRADKDPHYFTIAETTENDGTFTWTVPAEGASVPLVISGDAKIIITSKDFPNVSDDSDTSFRILSVRLTSPEDGAVWQKSKTNYIIWDVYGLPPAAQYPAGYDFFPLTIAYKIRNPSTGVWPTNWTSIKTFLDVKDGRTAWTIPGSFSTANEIKMIIFSPLNPGLPTDPTGASIIDTQAGTFAIVPTPTISVSLPQGLTAVRAGEPLTINWQTNQRMFQSEYTLKYLKYSADGLSSSYEAFHTATVSPGTGVPNSAITGSYTWQVPLDAIPPRPNPNDPELPVRIQVVGTGFANIVAADGSKSIETTPVEGVSADFYVHKPVINITSPIPFQTIWVKGDDNKITWSTIGTISNNLSIKYSLDTTNGTNGVWVPIANNVSNVNRVYLWENIPETAVSNRIWVKITDNDSNTLQGKPEAAIGPFTILDLPQLVINKPPDDTDGTTLTLGKLYDLRWTTYGNDFCKVEGVEGPYYQGKTYIYYSVDGADGPWKLYEAALSNTGVSSFMPPEEEGASFNAYIKIDLHDNDGPKVTGISQKLNFGTPNIVLQAPDGGETWYANGYHTISWKNVGAVKNSYLKFYYSTDNGSTWNLITNIDNGSIVAGTAQPGFIPYTVKWQVPKTIIPTGQNSIQVKLKIEDGSWPAGAVGDISVGQFTITKPTISISSPVATDSWVVGTPNHPISWVTTGGADEAIRGLKLEWRNRPGQDFVEIPPGYITASAILKADQYSLAWYVPDDAMPNNPDNPTDKATIRISDPVEQGGSGASAEVNFRVGPPKFLFITPNPNPTAPMENLYMGNSYTIQWATSGYIPDGVNLTYTDGTNWHGIDATGSLPSTGSKVWTVPETYSPGAYIVVSRPEEVDVPEYREESKAFSINYPTITVNRVNGEQPWTVTETRQFNWTSQGVLKGPFLIQWYSSQDNYVTGHTIYPPAPDPRYPENPEYWAPETTSISWTIPLEAEGVVRVRVNDTYWGMGLGSSYRVFDDSDPFAVLPKPEIYIISPSELHRGANCLRIGKQYIINWDDNGGVISNDLKIQYSTDNGVTYKDIVNSDNIKIAEHVTNSGSFAWELPKVTEHSTNCKIKITDNIKWKADQPNAFGESAADKVFEIGIPLINLTYPQGEGIYWAVGEKPAITWSTEGFINLNSISLLYTASTDPQPADAAFTAINQTFLANTGSYSWTAGVPDLFSIFPTATEIPIRLQARDVYSNYNPGSLKVKSPLQNVTVLRRPVVGLVSPLGTEAKTEYEIGETLPIVWNTKGISLNRVKIAYFASDNPTVTYPIATIDCMPNQTNSFNWIIPNDALISRKIRVRVSMVDAQGIEDPRNISSSSTNDIRFKGAFTITNLNTEAQRRKIVGKSEAFTWSTKGNIPEVKFEYFNGTEWDNSKTVIVQNSGATANQCTIVIPEPRSEHCKFKISDNNDPTVFVESPEFKADYYRVTWEVFDFDTGSHLDMLGVKDDKTGWLVDLDNLDHTPLLSPVTHDYPAGSYITRWSKKGYIARAADWRADGDITVTVRLENELSAQVEWHVILSNTYNPSTDTLRASTWLERRGKLVGPLDTDAESLRQQILSDLKSASLEIYDGDTLVKRMSTLEAGMENAYYRDNNGIFWFNWPSTGLEAGKNYFVKAIINYSAGQYISGASLDITSAKNQLTQSEQLTDLQTQAVATQNLISSTTNEIKSKVDAGTSEIKTKLEETKSSVIEAVTTGTSKILTAQETVVIPAIQATQKEVTTVKKSAILNRENTVRTGQPLTIRYRTYSGVSPTIQVYDPENKQALSGKMYLAAQEADTAIYEYVVTFENAWGRGDFTVICSEASYGSLDALIISVIRSDIEQVAGQVSAIMGSTSGISTLKDVADSLNSQFSVIESALSQVGKSLVKDAKASASSNTQLESIYGQLSNIAKTIKKAAGKVSFNVDKLYEVSTEKQNDMKYLKNKTQQLKASMELNTKMIDNIANKPVTQTWYEYR